MCEEKNSFFITASLNNRTLGFALVSFIKPNVYEISVMGVLNKNRRHGVGTAIMNYLFNKLKGSYLLVKTVDETKLNDTYASTRNFYIKTGFQPLITLPEVWDEENPCLIMIKKL